MKTNRKLNKLKPMKSSTREIVFEVSDDKISALLEYLETSLLRSEIFSSIDTSNVEILTSILNDRINDISLLSSICYGLLNTNISLKTQLKNLEKTIKRETDNGLEKFCYEDLHNINETSDHKIPLPISDFSNLKQQTDQLYVKNDSIMTEMLQLSRTRESCEHYERSLVDKIVHELVQKRQETDSMAEKISQCISDLKAQQSEMMQLIVENVRLRKKCNKMSNSKRKLKIRIDDLEKSIGKTNEANINSIKNKPGQECINEDQKNSMISGHSAGANSNPLQPSIHLDSPSNYNRMADTHSGNRSSHGFSTSPINEENKLSTKVVVDENGNTRIQVIKMSQNSSHIQKWRRASEYRTNEGLNQLMTPQSIKSSELYVDYGLPRPRPFSKLQPINKCMFNTPQTPRRTEVAETSTGFNLLCTKASPLPPDDTYQIPNKNLTLNHIQQMEDVSKVDNQFGAIPLDSENPSVLSDTSSNRTNNKSFFNTIKQYFEK